MSNVTVLEKSLDKNEAEKMMAEYDAVVNYEIKLPNDVDGSMMILYVGTDYAGNTFVSQRAEDDTPMPESVTTLQEVVERFSRRCRRGC